jgi:hypothetical protein
MGATWGTSGDIQQAISNAGGLLPARVVVLTTWQLLSATKPTKALGKLVESTVVDVPETTTGRCADRVAVDPL